MSPFYAPHSLSTDRLDVCSDCGSLVSRAARALHDKVCPGANRPQVKIEMPVEKPVVRSALPGRSALADERNALWLKAVEDGVFKPYRTAGGKATYKFECTVCHTKGMGPTRDDGSPYGTWWVNCAEGHPFGCTCGRVFSTLNGRAAHVRAMQRNHPDDSHVAVSA